MMCISNSRGQEYKCVFYTNTQVLYKDYKRADSLLYVGPMQAVHQIPISSASLQDSEQTDGMIKFFSVPMLYQTYV